MIAPRPRIVISTCLQVCLSRITSVELHIQSSPNFCACVTYDCGSDLLCWCCNTLCTSSFYPLNAMLARVLAVAPCLSVTSQCSIKRDEWINQIIFGFDHSYTVFFKEIQVSAKIRVLPPGTFSKILDLENFAMAYRSSNVLST